jgi:thiol-disulfide isomerase/thioredoxin
MLFKNRVIFIWFLLSVNNFACDDDTVSKESSCKEIVIEDPDVELAVLAALHKDVGDNITDEEIKNIKFIHIDGAKNLCTLDDLACIDELSQLEIANAPVTSLSPINRIDDLAYLDFFNTNLTDIAPLFEGVAKKYLNTLVFEANLIDDLTGLETATTVKSLFLGYNRITDISPLKGMTSIQRLSLVHNQITNIKPLVDNPGLSQGDELYITDNPLGTDDCADIETLVNRGVKVIHSVIECQ